MACFTPSKAEIFNQSLLILQTERIAIDIPTLIDCCKAEFQRNGWAFETCFTFAFSAEKVESIMIVNVVNNYKKIHDRLFDREVAELNRTFYSK